MFKKLFSILSICAIFVLFIVGPSFAEEKGYSYFKSVKFIIGQKDAEVNFSPAQMEQPAYVKDGRTLVPFRFLGESLGAEIFWDGSKKQAKLNLAGSEVIVTIGSKVAYVDGKMSTLDVPAEISGGRTFIPLRFVSEALGAIVGYTAETKTVDVKYVDKSNWKEYTAESGLKFKYPADWIPEEAGDNIVTFQSPKGSKMWVYAYQKDIMEINKELKQIALENGWKLINEELDVPNNIQEGFKIDFTKFDVQKNKTVWYIDSVDPINDSYLVVEMIVDEDYLDFENSIMYAIAFS